MKEKEKAQLNCPKMFKKRSKSLEAKKIQQTIMSDLIDEEKEINPLVKNLMKEKIVPRSEQRKKLKLSRSQSIKN